MSAFVAAGLVLPVTDRLTYSLVSIGSRGRAQCSALWGYDNGKVIEGQGSIACLTHDQGCEFMTWINGTGESWVSFTDGVVGSRGTEYDLFASSGAPHPLANITNTGGGDDIPGVSMTFSDNILLPMAIGPNEPWTVDLWYAPSASTTLYYIASGVGPGAPTVQTIYNPSTGASTALTLGLVFVDGAGNIVIGGNNGDYGGITWRPGGISSDFALTIKPTGTSSTPSAVMPFINVTGDLFKQDIKMLIEVTGLTRHAGNGDNNLFDLQFDFLQVRA